MVPIRPLKEHIERQVNLSWCFLHKLQYTHLLLRSRKFLSYFIIFPSILSFFSLKYQQTSLVPEKRKVLSKKPPHPLATSRFDTNTHRNNNTFSIHKTNLAFESTIYYEEIRS